MKKILIILLVFGLAICLTNIADAYHGHGRHRGGHRGHGGHGHNCAIATATYGDENHPNVVTLRDFRDKWMMSSNLGQRMVEFYYQHNQSLAVFILNHKEIARPTTKVVLLPVVWFAEFMNQLK